MLQNYFRNAIRHLANNKLFSFLNISGLALGMACTLLLLMNIHYVWSTDKFHAKIDRLFLAYNLASVDGKLQAWNATPAPLGPALAKTHPAIKRVGRLSGTQQLITTGDKKLLANGYYADPEFLNLFSFPLLSGNPLNVLNDPNSIVLTEDMAQRLFANADPIGQLVRIGNKDNFKVTGLLKTPPPNTSFKFEFLLPWKYLVASGIENPKWDNNYVATYIELDKAQSIVAVNKQVKDIISRYSDNTEKVNIFLHPFSKEHLYNRFENGVAVGGNADNLWFLFFLAILLLGIACINFMNLATARYAKRAREVGVRKVVGAGRHDLIKQFLFESLIATSIAAIISFILIEFVVPQYNNFANVQLKVPYDSIIFWLLIAGFISVTSIIAGSYPAFYLSHFQPVKVLKGVVKNPRSLITPRKVLVVAQFCISVFLINFTLIFNRQVQHTLLRDPGFEKEGLVFHAMTDDLRRNFEAVRNELTVSGTAISVSQSNTPVLRGAAAITGLEWEGKDPQMNSSFEYMTTDADFARTNGIRLLQGRDIDVRRFPYDTTSCMINETAMKVMQVKDPISKKLGTRTIVGVVSDFLIVGANQANRPVYIEGSTSGSFLSIRLNPGIEKIGNTEAILGKFNPGFITELLFADVEYAKKFSEAKNASVLIGTFAGMAIFISCLGLFGLSAYTAESKTREIGIRKVLGANVSMLVALLTKDFVKLVVVAILIATPLGWWFMNMFLNKFEYRTEPSILIPVLSAVMALVIAIISVSVESIRVALANPVHSLRNE